MSQEALGPRGSDQPSPKDQYQAYSELYRHYSNLIFRARVAILTIVFLAFGYLLGIVPSETYEKTLPIHTFGVEIAYVGIVSILAAYGTGFMFLLELAYYKRFLKSIACLAEIEKTAGLVHGDKDRRTFFGTYERKHWQYCFPYFFATLYFAFMFFDCNKGSERPLPTPVAAAISLCACLMQFALWIELIKSFDDILFPDGNPNEQWYVRLYRWL